MTRGVVPKSSDAGRGGQAADDVPGTLVDGELLPDWLVAADAPWLRDLLLQAQAFVGRPFAELAAAWRRGDVPPRAGLRFLATLAALRGLLLARRSTGLRADAPGVLRRVVFAAVARGATRAEALAAGAASTGLAVDAVNGQLFADLGEQRCVRWPQGLDADQLRRATNGRFARALLATANACELELHGQSRTVLRTAWLHGASFRFVAGDAGRHAVPASADREDPEAAVLRARCTGSAKLVWTPATADHQPGRRLAALVPVLGLTRRFVLRARCRWRGSWGTLVLTSLDALPIAEPTAAFDSKLEAAVAARLSTELPGWELVREPTPLPLGSGLAFPDFALLPPRAGHPSSSGGAIEDRLRGARVERVDGVGEWPWWIELAGLRDPKALSGKVALLERFDRYVLCVPRARCPVELVGHSRVVPFGRGTRGVVELVAAVRRVVGG